MTGLFVLRSAAVLLAVALAAGCTTVPTPEAAPEDVHGLASDIEPCPETEELPQTADSDAERLPSLELPCLGPGAQSVDLAQLGGRPTLINLWASWCGPCRKEMPALQRAYERHGSDLLFLGVDTTDSPDAAADFIAQVAVTYPQVHDADGELLRHLGVPGLPVTLMVDEHGAVVERHVGPLDDEAIEDLVQRGR